MQQVITIPTRKIRPNRYQPRLVFNEESITELAQSIKENGLIQPIVVRDMIDYYEIIAGERRFRACQSLGMETIPAVIKSTSEMESAQLALIENIQREDLSAIEEAKAYLMIMRQSSCTQDEMASRMGKSQSTIANKIRLLGLPEEVQNAITERKLTERHGRALLNVEPEKQHEVFEHVISHGLNVAQTEAYVKTNVSKKKETKQKTKAVARHMRIAFNTIYQAVKMVTDAGIEATTQEVENDDEFQIIIKFPKK